MSHAHYNPHNPLVVGNEYAPVLTADYTPELFIERGWQFKADDTFTAYRWMSIFFSQIPPWPVPGHAFLFTMYRRGQETATGPVQKMRIPVAATATANTTTVGGGGSATTALANPTDNAYVRLGVANAAEAYIRMAFDTAAASEAAAVLDGRRIVNVSLVYSAFAEPGNETPLPVNVFHRRNSDAIRINMGQLDIPLAASSIITGQEHRIGEINSFDDPLADDPLTQVNYRMPWRYQTRGLFDLRSAGNQRFEIQVASATVDGPREIYVQYAALEVTYCEENRVGVMGFVRGADYDATCVTSPNGYRIGRNTFCGGTGMADPQTASVPTVLETEQGTITIKRSDYGPYNNQGPTGKLRALRTIDLFPDHPGVVIDNTTMLDAGGEPQLALSDTLPQIILHDPDGPAFFFDEDPSLPWTHTYGLQTPLDVHISQTVVQEITETAAAPATPYPNLRFWARSQEATAALVVSIETASQGPVVVGQIAPEQWARLPEIADGWRQVDMVVDTALLVDDTGTVLTPAAPRWSSSTAQFRPWQILAARLDTEPLDSGTPGDTGIGTYGDNDAEGSVEGSAPATADIDAAVMWAVQMPDITGLAVDLKLQDLAPLDPECPTSTSNVPTGLYYLTVSWEPVPDGYEFAGLGYYELARRDTTMDAGAWETVATPTHPLAATFDDYEARVDVAVSYRVRYVHASGVAGDWSDPVTETIPAPGAVGSNGPCKALLFTSNADPALNVAYPTAWTGQVDQAQTFLEAETRTLQRLHRRDYQTAFRPAERGGVAFTRSLLVSDLAIPVETLRAGARSIRDLAWADLPYVCVRDRHADRWLSNVNVPDISIRDERVLQVVQATITEVTDTPWAPSPGYCEGLRTDGNLPGTVYNPNHASTPGGAHLDSADTLEIIAAWRPDLYQNNIIAARYDHITENGWALYVGIDGTMSFIIIDAPPADLALFNTAPLIAPDPGVSGFVRFQYAANAPAGPPTGQFAVSADGVNFTNVATSSFPGNQPIVPTFTDLPLTAGATFDGTSDFVPGEATGSSGGWNGVLHSLQVSGDTGLLADVDFAEQDPDASTFADATGNVWVVSSGALCGGETP